jgi:ATP-dependent Lhr-like helicase
MRTLIESSLVFDWFRTRYGEPTPAQREAWPRIIAGENVLVASPTGTGKTFAAFLSVLDALAREHAGGELRDGIRCVYVSPLRALSYDLEKNLNGPLHELFGDKSPIRVALRTGDTTANQRMRQYHQPPHILLTTPESLCLLLSQEKWLAPLSHARWLVVDEIHALAENKRGAHLAISMERLAALAVGRDGTPCHPPRAANESAPTKPQRANADGTECRPYLQRIGLSATVAPLAEVAQFLVGTHGRCEIVDASSAKKIELRVHTPLRKDPYPEAGFTGERLVRELGTLIRKHRTTLVFCNTRSGAEATTFWLRENFPDLANVIECHHASLEREVRRDVEDRLKRGELRAVICSTSLELGIDIGSVELVVMMATPKGVSKALQRAGRAGHNIHSVSRGVLMATNISDLVESCATVLLARTRHLDDVRLPECPLDVLAQHLVSMGCTARWTRRDALALVRGAYPFRGLNDDVFADVLDYLAGGGASLRRQYTDVFGKIELDDEGFATKPGRVQRDFLQNVGTIPSIGSVRIRTKTRALGSVDEGFIRQLRLGDVFIIAGRPVRLEKVTQMEAWVTRADGETPTVPRWNANKMPLSNRVANEISAFRGELRAKLEQVGTALRAVPGKLSAQGVRLPDDTAANGTECRPCRGHEFANAESAAVRQWIAKRLDCGKANAAIIFKTHLAQHEISEIPTADTLLVEEFVEMNKERPRARHYFFHSLIGRAANDALARVVTYRLSKLRGGNAIATPHDYGFVLTVTPAQSFTETELPRLLDPRGFATELEASLAKSEMLKYHFRNAAQTGLMVYRNQFSTQKPIRKLAWSAEVIFNVLQQHEPDHVLLREARRDALRVFIDAEGAATFLEARRPVRLRRVERVPPLSFAMYATKIKEALLIEDPFETMERLYHQWWTEIEGSSSSSSSPS